MLTFNKTVCQVLCHAVTDTGCLVSLPVGLDSFAARSVMGYLQEITTANQQTVIATIHQPRSAIWEMFHTVRQGR